MEKNCDKELKEKLILNSLKKYFRFIKVVWWENKLVKLPIFYVLQKLQGGDEK